MLRLCVLYILSFWHCFVCFGVDFDVVVVGSSPIPLLEALYHFHSGKRVLILEKAPICGGAWKSISVCGMYPVDLGCHTLGNDKQMHNFLQDYVGCTMVSLDNPHSPFESGKSPNGFYFEHGCSDLMHNLLQMIEKTDIVLFVDCALESVYIDAQEQTAIVRTKNGDFTTSKILVTPYSHIKIDNYLAPAERGKKKYYHLYLLVDDPSPQRFSFLNSFAQGLSRVMNLTYFVGLEGTGKQLMVLQVYAEKDQRSGDSYFEALKNRDMVGPLAQLLCAEPYIYEQANYQAINNKEISSLIEVLNTNHIQNMSKYIPKWKGVFPLFQKD